MIGKVYLVGAGPGDEGLITVKALTKIKQADVILYDRLANPKLLDEAEDDVELFYVGKKAGNHYRSQEEINQLLVDKAKEGKEIVRLKGGDPFIFGRGGEEAEVLAREGISFEIIPGITSPISVAAYAGIPLTHRDFSSSVAFVTGHEDPSKEESSVNWDYLAKGVETLVTLMGVGNLAKIANRLMKAGKDPQTPVALIRWGTRPEQESIVGNLENIAAKVEEADFNPPAITIIGDVVTLRDKLNWFEKKSLFGKDIVVTRPKKQATSFCKALAREGANVVEAPAIKIEAPDDYQRLDESIGQLKEYDWIIFTSINGVKYFFARLFELGKDARALGDIKVCAIGPKTAQAVKDNGIKVDYLPDDYVSEAIVKGFAKKDLTGKKFLLPRANIAREMLSDELEKFGAEVDNITAYKTVAGSGEEDLTAKLKADEIDLVTFTSSSTVDNFIKKIGGGYQELLENTKIAAIGPITASTAEDFGLEVDIIADEYTIEGLLRAIKKHYKAINN